MQVVRKKSCNFNLIWNLVNKFLCNFTKLKTKCHFDRSDSEVEKSRHKRIVCLEASAKEISPCASLSQDDKVGKFEFLCKIFDFLSFLILESDDEKNAEKQMTDNEIAILAQQDPHHFTEIFERYFKKMYRFFYFRIRNEGDAEDLTSETFEKAFNKIHTFQEKGLPFSAWIFRIARNTFIDHLRKNKIRIEPVYELLPSEEPSEDFDIDSIDRGILSKYTWEAINQLPQRHQEVWGLKLADDMPHKQIAKILGISEGNVNVIVFRSIEKIKKKLSHLNVSL